MELIITAAMMPVKTEKSVVETSDMKEDSISSKPSQVATPSLINGHDKWLESEPIQLEINQEKELENQSEIDGQQASNGTGEECLVERWTSRKILPLNYNYCYCREGRRKKKRELILYYTY